MNLKFSAKVVRTMNCNEIKDMLPLYIDGELEDTEKKLVEEHIEKCENCKKELEEYKKIIYMLQNMTEEEPPKGYCKRLHEKLLKTKVEKKISTRSRWIKYGSIAAAFVLVVSVIYTTSNFRMGSMNKSESNTSYDTTMQATEAPAAPELADEYGGGKYGIASEEDAKAKDDGVMMRATYEIQDERELKIIKSGSITTQTEGYDLFINELLLKVEELGGYTEQNNTNVSSSYNDKKLKYGYLKLRVPQDRFNELVIFLEESSEVNQKNIVETDVTKEYYEKDNQVKNLELQEVHLRELFEKAQTVEEMLQIENELRRIRTEIDALNISLSDIDDRASMSTITIEVQEVLKANITMSNRDNVWERAKEGFINTINGIVELGENLIVALISLLPVLLPLLIILIIVFIKFKKRKLK